MSPRSISHTSDTPLVEIESRASELSRISDETVDILLKAYQKHISTRWLALSRRQILRLHEKGRDLEDSFEISTLNLVYAIAWRFF